MSKSELKWQTCFGTVPSKFSGLSGKGLVHSNTVTSPNLFSAEARSKNLMTFFFDDPYFSISPKEPNKLTSRGGGDSENIFFEVSHPVHNVYREASFAFVRFYHYNLKNSCGGANLLLSHIYHVNINTLQNVTEAAYFYRGSCRGRNFNMLRRR